MSGLKLYGLMAIAAAILVVAVYLKGRGDGAEACEARHAAAQVENMKKVEKLTRKIKHAVPADSDDAGIAEFLLNSARE